MHKFSKEQLAVYSNLPQYADIESRGFWGDVHTTEDIHVLLSVVDDPETGEEVPLIFHDRPDLCGQEVYDEIDDKTYIIPERAGTLLEGFRFWYRVGQSEKGYLSVHNNCTYDKPIVEKVMPKCLIPDEKWVDTFIQSKIQWFDRPTPKGAKSGHGLAAYGIIHGIKKPDITDFTVMDAKMIHRCLEDCKIQKMAHKYLQKERDLLEAKIGITFDDAYKMEWEYAKTCHAQEVYGAMADREHMEACVEKWDVRLHELESIIEPLLPPTVKATGGKVSRKEMAVLLGYPKHITDKMHEPTEMRKRNGEDVEYVIKPYAKPTVKWTNIKKTNQYSGEHISYGYSPSFIKKKDLTDWIKDNHPDTKPKEWEIEKSEIQAELVNSNNCKYFGIEPEDMDLIGGAFTKVKFEASTLTQHDVVKGMLIRGGIKYANEWNIKKDDNGMVKATENMTVSYPPKASYENQLHYHIKKGEPIVTSPKFGEKEYEQLETDEGKMVGEYNTTMHRRRFMLNPNDPEEKGLIANIRKDGRLPCGVNNSSTGTLRSSHRIWVNAPGDGALYGKEVRQSIIASPSKILVSHDMNSAQLSIAAYYANNYDYFKAVCFGQETKLDEQGNDILHPETGKKWYLAESGHCTNMQAFGLVSPDEVQRAIRTQDQELIHDIGLRRKKSKSATFGVIFGCSGKKLALMLGIAEAEGNKRKNMFLEKIGLDRPMQILDAMCEKNKRGRGGYIELPFGYYAFCSSPHARFNYLD
ncbi:coil containing protein [Vibrio phage 1.161.O._10N.261.48.C5]|nr:coil containing protein [Vibrio phage 1.161.O._10N.261.48.C5]